MKPVLIAAGIALTVLCWGVYGPILHKGQAGMENSRLKPLICVGLAYFVIAIVIPLALLVARGELPGGWQGAGLSWSLAAGAAGAIGALGTILALTSGGSPTYVMPMVFGCAPIVNTILSMYWSKAWKQGMSPIFFLGIVLVAVGATLVLSYAPRAVKPHGQAAVSPAATPAPLSDISSADA